MLRKWKKVLDISYAERLSELVIGNQQHDILDKDVVFDGHPWNGSRYIPKRQALSTTSSIWWRYDLMLVER